MTEPRRPGASHGPANVPREVGGKPSGGCSTFTKLVCAGTISVCAAGCVGATVGYAACVVPCLTAAGMLFCKSRL